MRAIRRTRYGGPEVLAVEHCVEQPLASDRVRIAVRAASLNPFEWHHQRGLPLLMRPSSGWTAPRDHWLGVDVAGVVVELGADVDGDAVDLHVGDEVFGGAPGSLADRADARPNLLAKKPAAVSFEEAAAVPLAGLTALQALRKGRFHEGHAVLVLGASGGVGHYAVQLARALGASRVVGSCSTRNVALVRSLGADDVLDYTRGDVDSLDECFDVVLDIAGGAPVHFLRQRLKPGGSVVLVGGPGDGRVLGPATRIVGGLLTSAFRPQRVVGVNASWSAEDLQQLAGLLERGHLRSVIHRRVSLDETADALAEVEAGHVAGKIVVVP